METIIKSNFNEISKIIKNNTPPSRQAPDYDCIAIKGCDINSIIKVGRNGEYYDFTVKVLDRIQPLFTDAIIIKAMELLIIEEYDSIIRLFDIRNEFLEFGYNVICYTIYNFFIVSKIMCSYFKDIKYNFKAKTILDRLNKVRNDTIDTMIEVVNIGNNVVPSSFIGKQFKSGEELHRIIDTLEWRRGKPPVTYCCTYGMTKINTTNVNYTSNLNIIYDHIISIDMNQKAMFIDNSKIKDFSHYIEYNKMIIVFNPKDHFHPEDHIELEKYSVGLLSSILQKSIRHGRCSKSILLDTINKMARAKPYNLPDQQFLKVSGARQLFWRFFITIIEDVRYYYDDDYINLFDILILAMITNKEPNYIINTNVIDKMLKLGERICCCDNINDYYEWRNETVPKEIIFTDNTLQNVMYIAMNMPKMQGDGIMISKYYNLLKTYKPLPLVINSTDIKCKKCSLGMTPQYTGVDIHSNPMMIIRFQAITSREISTQDIASLIWELNSMYNNRKPQEFKKEMFHSVDIINITRLQKEYYDTYVNIFDLIENSESKIIKSKNIKTFELSKYNKRILFLKIFGEKIKIPTVKFGDRMLEVVFSYNDMPKPIQMKYVNSEEYLSGIDYEANIVRTYEYIRNNKLMVTVGECLPGYEWIVPSNVMISIDSCNNPIVYYKQANKIETISLIWFDGSPLVTQQEIKPYIVPNKINTIIINRLLSNNTYLQDYCDLDCNIMARRKNNNFFDIKKFHNSNIFKGILIKFYTAFDNIITIAPVNRNGMGIQQSCDYMKEGHYWKLLNLLHYCYPEAIKVTGKYSYKLIKASYMYKIMLNDITYSVGASLESRNLISPKIVSKLWDHQLNTSNYIISNIKEGKRGFGDASNVGAGKTLTALATCCEIFKLDNMLQDVLILVPSESLIDTWTKEIDKHYSNINMIVQKSNGKLIGEHNINLLNCYITTMGRNRDKPIKRNWLFVIIDECLTVQNKEAQQTMAAWEQIVCSKYGVLLLSATFFRTRFDKLLYMLKMLCCDLPETKEYLDTILIDSIKVNLPTIVREWKETIYKEALTKELLIKYNNIKNKGLSEKVSNERLYIEMTNFIRMNVDYIKLFHKYIDIITKEKPKTKLLIYASSKMEAEKISNNMIGLYPDISKTHVVVSYAVGTYGLNNLTEFNHILTRPPEPDKLPQMKGRLDRMGQKENILNISYILIENTIEEMEYMKLELCNKFYSNHIMPLSDLFNLP